MGRVDSGKKILILNGKRYTLDKNQWFFIPAHAPHSCYDGDRNGNTGYTVFCADDVEILINAIKEYDTNLTASLSNITKTVVTDLNPQRTEYDNRTDPLIMQIIHFIDGNYWQQLTVSHLAIKFCLSPFHLLHRFKKTTGLSLHQYILQTRIKKFRDRAEQKKITEQALECGFYDQSHLNRIFKRYIGITPFEYVRTVRKGLSHLRSGEI
jgi:AraC-like DNA-binding protein